MGHQSQHVSGVVGDAGNVRNRAIWIGLIAQGDGIGILQLLQGVVGALIAAFPMGDGQGERLVCSVVLQPWCAGADHLQRCVFTDEVKVPVAGQGSRQESQFGQHLKSVADPQYGLLGYRSTNSWYCFFSLSI